MSHVESYPLSPEIAGHRRSSYKINRRGILEQLVLRDGLACAVCGKQFNSKRDKDLTIDHKVPIVQGGNPLRILNLQLLCSECHRIKEEKISAE